MKELKAEHAKKRSAKGTQKPKPTPDGSSHAKTCRELLQIMPSLFDPSAAMRLNATYEFQVSGEEVFNAHLRIEQGSCTYAEGPADSPGVVIKTPASVWLSISRRARLPNSFHELQIHRRRGSDASFKNEKAVPLIHIRDQLSGMVFKKNRLCVNLTQHKMDS